MKIDCWEFNDCGRVPGGYNVKEMGLCPAGNEIWCDEVQKSKSSGKFCWSIAVDGKLCKNCGECKYYLKERAEVFE
jgi:hypothetical protein